ncbi:MAG: hypothetical protein IPP88_21905 [Betaproteobacteria bacterium]|nr:hypothetical protein [Betaproteobacteria bacterium]
MPLRPPFISAMRQRRVAVARLDGARIDKSSIADRLAAVLIGLNIETLRRKPRISTGSTTANQSASGPGMLRGQCDAAMTSNDEGAGALARRLVNRKAVRTHDPQRTPNYAQCYVCQQRKAAYRAVGDARQLRERGAIVKPTSSYESPICTTPRRFAAHAAMGGARMVARAR